jgi:sugar lactone lactonase YvrE
MPDRTHRRVALRSAAALSRFPALFLVLAGCTDAGSAADRWSGTIDTLASGRVVVNNPSSEVWDENTRWRVEVGVQIGRMDGRGPDVFGRIGALEVDRAGRLYVYEGQAQELRVFDDDGSHVRTVGREGGGPGEFKRVIGMAWAPDGNLWLVDPSNARISVFDTAGTYLTNHRTLGGFVVSPWPGGFDDQGRFYNYGLDRTVTEGFPLVLVRFDDQMEPKDTIQIPRYTGGGDFFELRSGDSRMRASVPFSPGVTWQLSSTGHVWFAMTGDYRLYQRTMAGDTVRTISREFDPLPVTEADHEDIEEQLEWFTRQGGKIDRNKFPKFKPAIRSFYLDDAGNQWVMPVTETKDRGRLFDIFDTDGRYLGRVRVPFVVQTFPKPIIRYNTLFAVTVDDLDVPYVVRARIHKPGLSDTDEMIIGAGH